MSCLRPVADLKAPNDLFREAIGFRHTLVLPEVIEPGVRQEGLDETALLCGILEYPPVIRAVSAALARTACERMQKRIAVPAAAMRRAAVVLLRAASSPQIALPIVSAPNITVT
jgi:hypothetical protein